MDFSLIFFFLFLMKVLFIEFILSKIEIEMNFWKLKVNILVFLWVII